MVVTNMTEISRAMDLVMPVSSAVVASHPGVVNSIMVIKGLLRRSAIVGGRRCNRWFGIFLFDERGRRWCVWSG
jgi:hypothetical protein